jgi:hypothetical protein
MSLDFEDVRADLAAFADDDEDVIIETSGQCLFIRGGKEISFRLVSDEEERLLVEIDDEHMPYRRFVSHRLAQLPLLAERILTKRAPVPAYVDSVAQLESSIDGEREGPALELLAKQSTSAPAFVSRVAFITADAGQGKTALLRQYQHDQADRFLKGESGFVFWHVDLQGRQLLRLSEALMGDLGDLRVAGLWMPAIVRLLRHRSLVLAIDGFDELAAEQGGSDALGALAVLVRQMAGRGTIVAASRRTFFDTDDYVRRARLVSRAGAEDCEFNQVSLLPWRPADAINYLRSVSLDGRRFEHPDAVYDNIVQELHGPEHPMVTRPFLLTQVAKGLLLYDMEPGDFIRGMEDPLRGVGAVIEAFVDREVAEKWKQKDTGQPFLARDQHLRLLADVAEEMFRSQRASIDLEVLETITALLLEEWAIEPGLRQQILAMVRMHVLLTPPPGGSFNERAFDHEEFRDWFTAYALKDRLLRLHADGASVSHDLLSVGHLSDSTARYVCALIERTPDLTTEVLAGLTDLVVREWRPTYLQTNVGTIIPFLLDGVEPASRFDVKGGIVFTSLVHEGKKLTRVLIEGASFVNASLANVTWREVELRECDLGELTVDRLAVYEDVVFVDCRIDGVRITDSGTEERREYAPERIKSALQGMGIALTQGPIEAAIEELPEMPNGDFRKLVRRVLNLFRRTTFLPETVVQQRFHRDPSPIFNDVLPLMEEFNVIEARPWRGSGRQRAWGLSHTLEEIERADGDPAHQLNPFWVAVDAVDAARAKR